MFVCLSTYFKSKNKVVKDGTALLNNYFMKKNIGNENVSH